MTATVTVEEIRQKYPNPIRASRSVKFDDLNDYCVGGAVVRVAESFDEQATGDGERFPSSYCLSRALRVLNPNLSKQNSNSIATSIVVRNDKGDFEGAWLLVKMALEVDSGDGT